MASGDTKTNQYLDIAANGTRADLPSDTCCETRTQTLIRGVAERIMDVEEEVEQLENNPDVVDIVDTYADLQGYDTSGLTDKDIIRVIADETKGGLSSYYRWNSPNPGWNFVGVIPGGDGIKELSSADYNYPTANPDRVALWLLDNGLYTAPAGVMVAASTTSYPWYNTSDKTILVGGSDTVKGIYTFLNGKVDVVTTQVSDGTEADEYTLLKSTQVLQATGQSITDTMSQKAITDAIAGAGGGVTELTTDDYNYPTDNPARIALWLLEPGFYVIPADGSLSGKISAYGSNVDDIYSRSGATLLVTKGSSNGSTRTVYMFVPGSNTADHIYRVYSSQNTGNIKQYATVDLMFADPDTRNKVQIGKSASATGANSVVLGYQAAGAGNRSTAIGWAAGASTLGSVALGATAKTTYQGEVAIGSVNASYGYNSSNYRLLTGLYDGQSAHDAVTVEQVNATIDAINTALSTSIPHIGASS